MINERALKPLPQKKLTLRLMSSPLCGCEFELVEGVATFVVAPARVLEISSHEGNNTFIIPAEQGGVNFEIINNGDPHVSFRKLGDPDTSIKHEPFNSLISIGSLDFIVKDNDEAWDFNILKKNKATERKTNKKYSIKKPKVISSIFVVMIIFFATSFFLKGESNGALKMAKLDMKLQRSLPIDKKYANTTPSTEGSLLSADDAEMRLRAMSINYKRQNDNSKVLFIISGILNDEDLQQIKLLNIFYLQQHVKFAVNLKDDPTVNTSYKYGGNSYVKVNPNHWSFNNLK
ncbi:hypothetical protein BS639_15265 [Rouxiella silvae]|uniref:Type III secretion system protein PrgH n=1 Tax=Rouxiella silvae TaxID=1646373 RepID=A0ABX3TYK5_9GAMM|nr:hypothetical protein BS639_15265 [Rouxiella silvae]